MVQRYAKIPIMRAFNYKKKTTRMLMHLKKQRTFMGYQQKVLPLQSLFRKHGNNASSEEREMGKSLTASSLGIPPGRERSKGTRL